MPFRKYRVGNPKCLLILSQWSCGLLITRYSFHAQKTQEQTKVGEGLLLLHQVIVSCCLLYESATNKIYSAIIFFKRCVGLTFSHKRGMWLRVFENRVLRNIFVIF
jgi:hypothetical protein